MNRFHYAGDRLQHAGAGRRGQALVETALTLPLLILLLVNAVNFGFYIYGYITVNNAARAIAQYRVYNGVAVGFPRTPTPAELNCVLNHEVSSLPNKGSPGTCGSASSGWPNITVRICSNRNGTVNCTGGGSYAPPADVEPSRFALYSAEVTYTFTPVIPPFVVPGINVPASLFPTTIYRHVLMRSMQ
jgi:hypothetical protein